MAVDAALETYIVRSIEKAVVAAAAGIRVEHAGMRSTAVETDEEWIRPTIMAMPRERSRPANWIGDVLLQISCFSRHAEHRADKERDRPWQIAAQMRAALEGTDVQVKTYGGPSTAWIGTAKLGRVASQYLDERGIAPGEAIGLHAVALTVRGFVTA